jgi:hypothetical protein
MAASGEVHLPTLSSTLTSLGDPTPQAVVPEPQSMALLISALPVLALLQRRFRRTKATAA